VGGREVVVKWGGGVAGRERWNGGGGVGGLGWVKDEGGWGGGEGERGVG